MSKYQGKNIRSNIEFKKKSDEKNNVSFILKSLEIIEENIPENLFTLFINEDDVTWNFSYSIEIVPDENEMVEVEFQLGIKLFYRNDQEENAIVAFTSLSTYNVTENINDKIKIEAINMLYSMSYWHLQGIYSAKLEGSPLSMFIPPELDVLQDQEYIKEQINDGW